MTQNKNYEILRTSVVSRQLIYYEAGPLFLVSKNIYEFSKYLDIIYMRTLFVSINRLIFIST